MALWASLFVITVLFVGLRHNVGMDWNNYLRMIYAVEHAPSFGAALSQSEPLYALLLMFGAWSGWGMYVVNLLATIVTMLGVFAFARRTPEPWIALVAALPMFIIVVCMSANRQALAAGLLMLLIANWNKFGLVGRSLFIVFCAGFHSSAIIFLAFVAVDMRVPRSLKIAGISLFTLAALYYLQQTGAADYYDQAYGSGQSEAVQSSGAIIHVAMTALPASFYFFSPQLRAKLFPTMLLRNIAFAAMATLPMVALASAAAGRISLYWFPVAMWVWSAIPQTVDVRLQRPVRLAICALMLLVMLGWLQFANSAFAHIPYQNALLMNDWELEIGILP
ncbi:MAG: EpsG family protein [Pontixanthobacter sp.]